MTKIHILKSNQSIMSWIGIYSYNLIGSADEFEKPIMFWFIASSLFIGTLMVVAFVYQNMANFEAVLEAVLLIVAGIQSLGAYLSIAFNMEKVKIVHVKLQEMVDKSEKTEAYDIYWNNEQKCRKYTKIIVRYILCHQLTFVAALFYSIYCISVGNLDTSTWPLPFHMSVPFDTKTFLGWYSFWILQFIMSLTYITCMVTITSYFISSCFYIDALHDHFGSLMHSIYANVQRNKMMANEQKFVKSYQRIKIELCEAIELHIEMIKISKLMADINSGAIFWILPLNILLLSISLYTTEQSASSFGPSILYDILCIGSSLIWPYLFCYFASVAITRISSIGICAYKSNWHNHPVGLQKYITCIIIGSQNFVRFTGLEMVNCSLETFETIIRSSCSYWLIFRRISQR